MHTLGIIIACLLALSNAQLPLFPKYKGIAFIDPGAPPLVASAKPGQIISAAIQAVSVAAPTPTAAAPTATETALTPSVADPMLTEAAPTPTETASTSMKAAPTTTEPALTPEDLTQNEVIKPWTESPAPSVLLNNPSISVPVEPTFFINPLLHNLFLPTTVSNIEDENPAIQYETRNEIVNNEYDIPQYEFQYSVAEPSTGDFKNQHESRLADEVTGSYSILQPNGKWRIVDYRANDIDGYIALVRYEDAVFGDRHNFPRR